jgi:hypothetical protein
MMSAVAVPAIINEIKKLRILVNKRRKLRILLAKS